MSADPLMHLLQLGRVPHALLVVGGEEHALEFAKALVQTTQVYHPDLHHYYPEGKHALHSVESMRSLANDVALSPFQAAYKVFMVHDAERMLPVSANALLKTLEEPAKQTVILFLTLAQDKLLPTLLSRCQVITYPQEELPYEAIEATLACLHGNLESIKSLEAELEKGHRHVMRFFELVMRLGRDALLLKLGGSPKDLFFPAYLEQIQSLPPRSLKKLETQVRQARLGLERSVKPEIVLRYLFV